MPIEMKKYYIYGHRKGTSSQFRTIIGHVMATSGTAAINKFKRGEGTPKIIANYTIDSYSLS